MTRDSVVTSGAMATDPAPGRERYRRVDLPEGGYGEFWLEVSDGQVRAQTTYAGIGGRGSGGPGAWTKCIRPDCLGAGEPPGGPCFAHSVPELRRQFLARGADRAQSQGVLFRGIVLTQELLDETLRSPLVQGSKCIAMLSFLGAEIRTPIELRGFTFAQPIEFIGATFYQHPINFTKCVFENGIVLSHAFFRSAPLSIRSCEFGGPVVLSYCQAEQVSLGLEGCVFRDEVQADGISARLILDGSTLEKDFIARNAKSVDMSLSDCTFQDGIDLAATGAFISAPRTRILNADRLGPTVGGLNLARSTIDRRLRIDVAGGSVNLAAVNLREGGTLSAPGCEVDLTGLGLGGPFRVSGSPEQSARIIALANADAGKMTFAEADMTTCPVYGAHGIGDIDIEPSVRFDRCPWWAARRRYIVDELAWRARGNRLNRIGWDTRSIQFGPRPEPRKRKQPPPPPWVPPRRASQVAAAYRDLRRSFEARSDMPGAADFYYGEMQMRKWSGETRVFERFMLWAYWLVAGYGVRPLRALIGWLATVVLGAGFLWFGAVAPRHLPLDHSLLFSVRAALPGFDLAKELSIQAEWALIALRVVGSVLVALFVLALRARFMRKVNV